MLTRTSFIRRYLPDFRRHYPETLVVSPGGVGTTFLMRHLARYLPINDVHDVDGLKHLPHPPVFLGRKPRVLFVYGDEHQSLASLKRRQWLRLQAAKLGATGVFLTKSPQAQEASYLAAVRRQAGAWRKYSGPLLMVEYDAIWDSVESMREFLEIPDASFVAEFPPRRPRTLDDSTDSHS